MPSETTMEIELDPKAQEMIEEHIKKGMYASPGDVIFAALGALESAETFGDFEPGELERLCEEGLNSGPAEDFDQFLEEFRLFREQYVKRLSEKAPNRAAG
jgi:putative addiction module CopG family antidote